MISRLPSTLPRNLQPLRQAPSKFRPSQSISSPLRSFSLSSPRYSSSTASTPLRDGPSVTAVFYKALLPSMLHCLALGSIVYYALELAYMTLSREKQVEELGDKVRRLEEALEIARQEPVEGVLRSVKRTEGDGGGKGKSWWKVW
ncbi:hypothetical protein JCM5353_003324 [Sporobolomyces roseus]